MSKTPRTPRASNGNFRPLGSVNLTQGTVRHSSNNDPALLINQLHLNANASSSIYKEKDILKEKEYQEKQKKLLDQISGLEKLIAQLRQQLKEKTSKCAKLEDDIGQQAQEYEKKLHESVEVHNKLKQECERAITEVKEGKELLQKTKESYETTIETIIKEYEAKLANLQETKDKEVKELEERMNVLKQRMAASLGKNSLERQQQLEELKRDLVKQAQEARELQQKLKQFKFKQCDNCARLQARLDEKTLQLRLKEKTLNEMQNLGKKMQVQLTQQGIILQKWEDGESEKK